jgi:hypothetical protein
VDLVFRLLHQISDQFSSLEKLVLAFHKNVCLSLLRIASSDNRRPPWPCTTSSKLFFAQLL